MSLSLADIKSASSDEALFKLLSSELNHRLPKSVHDNCDVLVHSIRELPRGMRAMAAIYRLDVSMAMDDLGWHFFNFYHRGLCDETKLGLRELEALEVAEAFEQALEKIEPNWEKIGQLKKESSNAFGDWYDSSDLRDALKPLNKRLWKICAASPQYGLMQFWLNYAQKYPERVLENR